MRRRKISWTLRNWILLLLGLLISVSLAACNEITQTSPWHPALTTHSVVSVNGLEQLWERSDVCVSYDWMMPLVTAYDGKVFLAGRLSREEESSLIALDATDGTPVWQRDQGFKDGLIATSAGLYVGDTSGFARVVLYDLSTGEVVWQRRFLDSNSVLYMAAEGDNASVYLNPDSFYVLRGDNGDTEYSLHSANPVFLRTASETFVRQSYSNALQLLENQGGGVTWEAHLYERVLQPPVFTSSIVFVRTDEAMGRLYAIDRNNGDILWNTDRIVISNAVVAGNVVFYLTQEGLLVGADTQTGDVVSQVIFTPAPFLVRDSKTEADGYYVAYDPKTDTILALLGDSNQLFGFRIQQP